MNKDIVSRAARVHVSRHGALELRLDSPGCSAGCATTACAAGRSATRLHSIPVDFQAVPGARLALQIDTALLGRISLLCYLLPAVMMLAGAGLASWTGGSSNDVSAIAGAIAGLALSGVVLRLYDSRHGFRLWQVEPDHQESGAGPVGLQ